jgi:CubicO group peptidase (beta-lactamase class C family)
MKIINLSVLLFFLAFHAVAQQEKMLQNLDEVVTAAMKAEQVPGLALAVIKDGQVVLMKSYGVKEQGRPDPVDNNTPFMIASNSKAFTGTAIALSEFEGRLKLDDPIIKWLPDFKLYDDKVTEMVTIRDMLGHHLGTMTFQGDFTFWSSRLTRDEVVYKMRYLQPKWGFRTRFGYCNSCFLTAGEALESAIGQTWESFIRERFFKPLDMKNAYALSIEMMDNKSAARPHAFNDGKLTTLSVPDIDNIAPAGSLSMSVSDLSHWLIMQMDTGRYAGTQVFPKQVILNTWNAQTIVNPANLTGYGLGWFIDRYHDKKRLSHTGGADGFVTSTAFLPAERLGVIVLTNSDANGIYAALNDYLLDIYLGIENKEGLKAEVEDWVAGHENEAERIAALKTKVKEFENAKTDLDQFAGKYVNELYGEVNLSVARNKLVMRLQHHPTSTAVLEWMGGNEFLCTFANPTLGIQPLSFKSENGKVTGLKLKVNNFVEYEAYDFIMKNEK